jgi:hypothetical protein
MLKMPEIRDEHNGHLCMRLRNRILFSATLVCSNTGLQQHWFAATLVCSNTGLPNKNIH